MRFSPRWSLLSTVDLPALSSPRHNTRFSCPAAKELKKEIRAPIVLKVMREFVEMCICSVGIAVAVGLICCPEGIN